MRPALRLWRDYLGRYRGRLAIALLAMGAYAASYSAIPLVVEWINKSLGDPARLRALAVYGPVLVIALGAVNAIAQYMQARLSSSAALHALRDMQADAHAALLAMDEARRRRRAGSGRRVAATCPRPHAGGGR